MEKNNTEKRLNTYTGCDDISCKDESCRKEYILRHHSGSAAADMIKTQVINGYKEEKRAFKEIIQKMIEEKAFIAGGGKFVAYIRKKK